MTKIEVVTIGNEILKGLIVNTNVTEISQALFQAGYGPWRHTSLPDDPVILKSSLQECMQRSNIVITSGGLGPTCDDITSQIAAELFESDFYYDEDIASELKQRYGSLPINLENQSTLPSKATILKNELGTAQGLVFGSPTSTLILMPGVPKEMRAMLNNQVIPYLNAHFPHTQHSISKKLHFFNLSESTVDPLLRQLKTLYPEIDFGIYPSHGVLSIVATIPVSTGEQGKSHLTTALDTIQQQFANNNFEAPSGKIEEAVHQLFTQNKWTLSLAESCTGGSISAHLVQLPGASAYFFGSLVCYSYLLKQKLLDVPEELLNTKGAVSEEAVRAMVQGTLKHAKSDFALAISGIAGPLGGTPDKPIGTVWIAVAKQGQPIHTQKIQAYGNREMVIQGSVNKALAELLLYCRSFVH